MTYQDEVIDCKHGEWIYSEIPTEPYLLQKYPKQVKIFRFRCGSVPKRYHYSWYYRPTHNQKRKAVGYYRYPRIIRTLRWAEAHKSEGIKVRNKGNAFMPDPYGDDEKRAHSEKNWKRHRAYQYKQ